MYQKMVVIFAAGLLIWVSQACKHDSPVLPNESDDSRITESDVSGWRCSTDTVYFRYDVLPVLISNCAMSGCHDATSHKEGVQLTDYQSVMSTGDISAGRPGNSELYKVIVDTDPGDIMPPPPAAPLTAAQIATIRTWIEQGARNRNCNPNFGNCDTMNVRYSTVVAPLMQTKCVGCHKTTSPGGNILLETYAQVKTHVDNGKLWGSINHLAGFSAMPQGGQKMPACELSKIRVWIRAGAPNN